MGSGVRRIVLLTLGWEELSRSVSVHGAPAGEILREPVSGVLLEVDGGRLLMRAITPFRAGDTVTFAGDVSDKRLEGGQGVVNCRVRGINQRGEMVCLSDATMMLPA